MEIRSHTFVSRLRQAINLDETAVGLNKRRLIQSAVVKELVRVSRKTSSRKTNLRLSLSLFTVNRPGSQGVATRQKQNEHCDVRRSTG